MRPGGRGPHPYRRAAIASTTLVITAGALSGLAPGGALAQSAWPARTGTLVVPYTAGGASDFGARLLVGELGKRLGQTVIVENVGGAGGALGVQKVVRAPADGYTLLYGSLGETVLVPIVNPAVNDRAEQLQPVAPLGRTPVAFVTRPDFAASNMDQLIDLARRSPGKLTDGSPGIGTFQHVIAETVKAATGTFWVHIPYRGGQNIVADVLAGQIDVGVSSAPNIAPMVASGRVKVLGVSSRERVSALGGAPSFSETPGLRQLDLQTWGMIFAPAGTSGAVLDRLNAAINEVNDLPAVREARTRAGSELPRALSVAESSAFFAAERDRYLPVARRIKSE